MASRVHARANGSTNGADIATKLHDAAEERRGEHYEADAIIIGAGVVGCPLSVTLAKQGRSVILLEKSLKAPDKMIGEYLQPGGVNALTKLGLGDCIDGIDSVSTVGYSVSYNGKKVVIPYPNNSDGTLAVGRSFHHSRFITKMRAVVTSTPNITMIEAKATSLIKSADDKKVIGVECLTNDEKTSYYAPLTFVCDGYNSGFRKEHLRRTPVVRSKFWGLVLIDADVPTAQHGNVLLNDLPPVLLYQIGTHETRAFVDIPVGLPTADVKNGGVKGHIRNEVIPRLPECLRPSFIDALDNGRLRSMPNSFLPPTTNKIPGCFFIGDSLNMRHALTGGGMTVGFHDILVVRDLLSPENVPTFTDTSLVLKQMSKFHWQRKGLSTVINILSHALYTVFSGASKCSRTSRV